MPNWKIVAISSKANDELAFLLQNAVVRQEVLRILLILASEADPRNPEHPDLVVERLTIHAPKWYRLKIASLNIRIVFRLLQIRDKRVIEYDFREQPWDDCENLLDITKAGYRDDDFYIDVQRRWRKSRGQ
jgi:hypothetical protein